MSSRGVVRVVAKPLREIALRSHFHDANEELFRDWDVSPRRLERRRERPVSHVATKRRRRRLGPREETSKGGEHVEHHPLALFRAEVLAVQETDHLHVRLATVRGEVRAKRGASETAERGAKAPEDVVEGREALPDRLGRPAARGDVARFRKGLQVPSKQSLPRVAFLGREFPRAASDDERDERFHRERARLRRPQEAEEKVDELGSGARGGGGGASVLQGRAHQGEDRRLRRDGPPGGGGDVLEHARVRGGGGGGGVYAPPPRLRRRRRA